MFPVEFGFGCDMNLLSSSIIFYLSRAMNEQSLCKFYVIKIFVDDNDVYSDDH